MKERVRSPKHARAQSRSPSPARKRESRSPSPPTKRLRRAQAEQEVAEVSEGDHRKPSSREERDSGMIERVLQGSKGRTRMIEGIPCEREWQIGRRTMVDHEDHLGMADQCLQKSIGIWVGINPKRHQGHLEVLHVLSCLNTSSRVDAASQSGDPDSLVEMSAAAESLEAKEKQKPSFELSGKLAEETNRVAGVNLLYSEPPEARKSDNRWRLYVFKGGEALNGEVKSSSKNECTVAAGFKWMLRGDIVFLQPV